METAIELAEEIMANAPISIRSAKQAIGDGSSLTFSKGMQAERKAYNLTLNSKDREEALNACVILAERYLTYREFPDKAIDIMDEVCSKKRLSDFQIPEEVLKLESKIQSVSKQKEKSILDQSFEIFRKLFYHQK